LGAELARLRVDQRGHLMAFLYVSVSKIVEGFG
jgi:hypothetical protein